ncbi:hypothetical protein LCGC14_0273120 [marine sediment metagenome]|uniref:Uncharacterized protein n=1 Tax=marine sediment metagenome TaxID=412755 RepID=A0A0F9WIW3_9ZZZZ
MIILEPGHAVRFKAHDYVQSEGSREILTVDCIHHDALGVTRGALNTTPVDISAGSRLERVASGVNDGP